MAENSKIEWTDHTFNPWIGCTKVSDGCKNCYAETMNNRYRWVEQWGPTGKRKRTSAANWRKPFTWNRKAEETGERKRVFCASLADVFEHNDELIDWRLDLFETVISKTPWLDWLVLTKRPEVAAQFFRLREDLLLDNVWLGVTVENQKQMERVDHLQRIPARIRFISFEPQIEEIYPGFNHWADSAWWAIVGGESGPGCRPFDPAWARLIKEDCALAGVAFFMKQLGGHPDKQDDIRRFPEDLQTRNTPT